MQPESTIRLISRDIRRTCTASMAINPRRRRKKQGGERHGSPPPGGGRQAFASGRQRGGAAALRLLFCHGPASGCGQKECSGVSLRSPTSPAASRRPRPAPIARSPTHTFCPPPPARPWQKLSAPLRRPASLPLCAPACRPCARRRVYICKHA